MGNGGRKNFLKEFTEIFQPNSFFKNFYGICLSIRVKINLSHIKKQNLRDKFLKGFQGKLFSKSFP